MEFWCWDRFPDSAEPSEVEGGTPVILSQAESGFEVRMRPCLGSVPKLGQETQ